MPYEESVTVIVRWVKVINIHPCVWIVGDLGQARRALERHDHNSRFGMLKLIFDHKLQEIVLQRNKRVF